MAAPRLVAAQIRMEDVTFRASAGTALPVTPSAFSEGYGMGLGAEVGVGVAVTPLFSMALEGAYQRFGVDAERIKADPLRPTSPFKESFEGGALSTLSGGFGLRYVLSESPGLQPYLAGGLAAQRITREQVFAQTSTTQQRKQTAFGVSFGLGVRLPVSYTAAFFIEPRYAIAFTAPERLHYVPVRVGFVLGEF